MTKGSIQWQNITPRMRVKTVKNHYEAAGRLVTWSGDLARPAQDWLNRRVKADKKRFA